MSGARPSVSQISKAAVFCPSIRTGFTELTSAISSCDAAVLRASSRQSSKLPSICRIRAP